MFDVKCTYRCTYVCGREHSSYKLEIVRTWFQSSVNSDVFHLFRSGTDTSGFWDIITEKNFRFYRFTDMSKAWSDADCPLIHAHELLNLNFRLVRIVWSHQICLKVYLYSIKVYLKCESDLRKNRRSHQISKVTQTCDQKKWDGLATTQKLSQRKI